MGLKNSFTKNQMLYGSKKSSANLGPNQLSRFPKLGNNTVEGVRDAFIQTKMRNSQTSKPEIKEDKKEQKVNLAQDQYRKIQSMFNTKIKK